MSGHDGLIWLAVKEERQREIVVGWWPLSQQLDGALVGGDGRPKITEMQVAHALLKLKETVLHLALRNARDTGSVEYILFQGSCHLPRIDRRQRLSRRRSIWRKAFKA